MTTDPTPPAKHYLPMKEAGWLLKRSVPDGWEDVGPMAAVYKRGEGYSTYSCDNSCGDARGATVDCRLARLGGEVVMYCPSCLLFEDVPATDDYPDDCEHDWAPVGAVRCKRCKYEAASPLP